MISPLAFVLVASIAYRSYEQWSINAQFAQKSPFDTLKKERILFLIFDEWDPCILFAKEENKDLFPASYRWRHHSFYATKAYPAGTDTAFSILSLTLGKHINQVVAEKGKFRATFTGTDKSIIWQEEDAVLFKELYNKGLIIGCTGGMLVDYGKAFAPYISQRSTICAHSLWDTFFEHFLRTFCLWIPAVEPGHCSTLAIRMSRFLHENDKARLFDLIKNNKCDFIFGHFHGGHLPPFEGTVSDTHGQKSFSYLSNLKVVDHFLDQLEQLLKQEGLWDSTTCILTSDHWFRMHMWLAQHCPLNQDEIRQYSKLIDHRIPLFIKLKNQHIGVEYHEETSTIFIKDLLYHLIDGSVDSSASLSAFLDHKNKMSHSLIQKWEGLIH